MTRVSVFMSSYNHADSLRQSIDSVLQQTFADFELFIVDDASTDGSWSIIQGCKDPRLRAHRNDRNRNDREAMRRVIMESAGGEYVAIHHSDNTWAPEKLQQQVDFLDTHPGIAAVFTNADSAEPRHLRGEAQSSLRKRILELPNRSRHEWLNYFFHHGNVLCHASMLIRRRCYDDCGFYRNGFAQAPDLDMFVRLCLKYQIHVLPAILVRYLRQPDEATISRDAAESRIRAAFEQLQLLQHYLKLETFQELAAVFPEAGAYARPGGGDARFALAMISLQHMGQSPAYQLFGLQLLFEAVSDPHRAGQLEESYGFRHKDFITLAAKYDVFAVEARRRLTSQMTQVQQELAAQRVQRRRIAKAATTQLREILQSETWRVSRVLIRLGAALSPKGSPQYQALMKLFDMPTPGDDFNGDGPGAQRT